MEMRKVLLACAVLCSIASIACAGLFDQEKQVLKACDDSERPIDDIKVMEIFNGYYFNKTYRIRDTDEFGSEYTLEAPTEIDTHTIGNRWELNCDSGEIKGTGELFFIGKGSASQSNDEDTTKLTQGKTYRLFFRGKFDKTPKEGDNCVVKFYLTFNGEEKSYCTTDKAEIYKRT